MYGPILIFLRQKSWYRSFSETLEILSYAKSLFGLLTAIKNYAIQIEGWIRIVEEVRVVVLH